MCVHVCVCEHAASLCAGLQWWDQTGPAAGAHIPERRLGGCQGAIGEGQVSRPWKGDTCSRSSQVTCFQACVYVRMCVCTNCCVYVHFTSAGEWVLFTVKEVLGRQFFFFFWVNACVQYPVAFSDLMVSFRVTAHPPSGTATPETLSLFVWLFKFKARTSDSSFIS